MSPSRQKPAAAALVLALALTACSSGSRREYLSVAAMPPGTSWYVFGATLSKLLEERLPGETTVEVIARGGGIGNPILVERGQASVAISQAATAVWAFRGTGAVYQGRDCPSIRALAGGLNSVWMTALLTEDYIARTGNDTLEKALTSSRPARIVMKPAGSVVPVVADLLFETLGVSRRQIIERGGGIIQVATNQIPTLLRDGRADLYIESSIRGHPTVTEVTTTVRMRFVDFPDAVLNKLKGPGVKATPMPRWFKGQSGPTKAVDMGTVLIVHKDMPDELAYLITRIVCEEKDQMVKAHKAWADFNPAQGGVPDNTGIPLHPGAEKYYREKGWLRVRCSKPAPRSRRARCSASSCWPISLSSSSLRNCPWWSARST